MKRWKQKYCEKNVRNQPHPSRLWRATFPKGEGFRKASPLGKLSAVRLTDEVKETENNTHCIIFKEHMKNSFDR